MENCRKIYGEISHMARVSGKLMEMQIPYWLSLIHI